MSEVERRVEDLLQRLVGDVERSVHALYRGDVRQNTMRSRSDTLRIEARRAILEMLGDAPAPTRAIAVEDGGHADVALSEQERVALMRCIMTWLPMSDPARTPVEMRCIPVTRELAPSWGERELARQALQRISG